MNILGSGRLGQLNNSRFRPGEKERYRAMKTTETKPTFTKGPWVFAYGSVYQGEDANTVEEFCGRIATMDRDNPHTQPTERDANARLIASAPELLEACRVLLSKLPYGNEALALSTEQLIARATNSNPPA